MKIGIASLGCHRRGGIERVALETVNMLAAQGHQVRLVTYEADQDALDSRVSLFLPRPPAGPTLRAAMAFPAVSDRLLGDFDDVRCGFGVFSPPGAVVWVTSVHARWLEIVRSREVAVSWKRRLNPFHPVIVRQSKRQFAPGFHRKLLAMGPAVAEDLVRFCAADRSAIELLPHGFDEGQFNVARAAGLRGPVREEMGFAENDRVVLCVANELERKGVPTLIRAFGRLSSPQAKLLLVGRLDSGTVQALAGRAGVLWDRVRVVKPQDDVAGFYAAADVFALPTLYDAWGLVIVEALACGCPVVTTARAGAASAIKTTRSGSVISDPMDEASLAEELEAWLDAAAEVDRSGIAKSVSDLTWQRVIERYEAVLASAAKSAPGSKTMNDFSAPAAPAGFSA